MRKSLLFEFEDLSWFPDVIRQGMTDFLRFIFTIGKLYEPVIPLISEGLEQTKASCILDLCSGGGGAIETVQKALQKNNYSGEILVTDKFPNAAAYALLKQKTNGKINYVSDSIDATEVPPNLKGFRTIFSGFHHFNTQTAKAVLQNAADAGEGIAIFDGGDKSIIFIIAIILLQPIGFLLFTPFIKPFRLSRIVFTYLLPVIPFCTVWDGVVSVIRLHKPAGMLAIANRTNRPDYYWKAGIVKNKFGMKIAYLIGYPRSEKEK